MSTDYSNSFKRKSSNIINLICSCSNCSLSEYADENMMDAYNLAICFGPTLMPAPEEKDQVQCQNQVNDLIKNMIVYHDDLFPKDLGGTVYEKYISQEPFDCDVGDSPTEQVTEDPDSEVYPSEDGRFSIDLFASKYHCFRE